MRYLPTTGRESLSGTSGWCAMLTRLAREGTCPGRIRRGIASLELVLVFPLLLAIVSVLFAIGQCDVAKVGTATDARRQTWAQRPKADPFPTHRR